jgi:NADPH:quinone reductase-like Zn-dependent oxidoreductase
MKAITFNEFGPIEVLTLSDLPAPESHRGAVLVRVRAASINPLDWKIRRGTQKLMSGTHFPKLSGADFAGVVEQVGEGVTGLSPGDEVYGSTGSMKEGAMAELVRVSPESIARKPASLDFPTAASVPVVALAARTALRGLPELPPGARVLVNGCTGGVGLYATQLARRLGAHVTGACSAAGRELALAHGCHEVLDYRAEPVTASGRRFDLVLELSGHLSFDAAEAVLSPHGTYLDFEPSPAGLVGNALANPFRSHKHRYVLTTVKSADLTELAGEFDRGELRPAPVRTFARSEFRAAYELAERGAVQGKIVIRLDA